MPHPVGYHHNEATRARIRQKAIGRKRPFGSYSFPKGHIPWNKGIKMGPQPQWLINKRIFAMKDYRPTPETRRKMSEAQRALRRGYGSNVARAGVWRGVEYKLWREAVFSRDDYRCYDCGERNGNIQADHILPFALFPRLRFDVNNGRTLCVPCHRKTPTYGGHQLTVEDFKQPSSRPTVGVTHNPHSFPPMKRSNHNPKQ